MLKAANSEFTENTIKSYASSFSGIVKKLENYENPNDDPAVVFTTPAYYKQTPRIARTYGTANSRFNYIKGMYSAAKALGFDDAYKWLLNQSLAMKKERDETATDQTVQTKKQEEDYVPFADLAAQAKHKVLAFIKLAESLTKAKKKLESSEDRMLHDNALVAWLNTAEPNIRGVLAKVEIVKIKPTTRTMQSNNILYVPKKGQCIIYVNADKVSKTKDSPAVDSWPWRNDTSDLIRMSLAVYDRKYLFRMANADKPLTNEYYNRHVLAKAFEGVKGKNPSQQTIRHATVDELYRAFPSPPLELQRDLARRMRHSVEAQNELYRKVSSTQWPSRVDLVKELKVPVLTKK
jgi:hypothetical protein